MHDPQYRTAIAWQNSAYNQPPYPSFYLGYDMPTPPVANIYMASALALPVKLLNFNATAKQKHVLVEWAATNELNSKHYVVERSNDGRNFFAIETVDDKGNSNNVNHYSTTDNNPLEGVSFYRLKQVDIDGKFAHSAIRKVVFGNSKQIIIYPNPASSIVKLDLPGVPGNLAISISNLDGRSVYKGNGTLQEINNIINGLLPALVPGYYNVQLTNKDAVYNGQLIKQ